MVKMIFEVKKKDLFLLISIVVLLVGTGLIIAYNPGGVGNPAVIGHSANELEGVCLSDGTNCNLFGNRTNLYVDGSTLVKNTPYNAVTDGIVTAFVLSTGSESVLYGYADLGPDPTTIVSIGKTSSSGPNGYTGISMPIKKGEYWKVSHPNTVVVWWMPVGS